MLFHDNETNKVYFSSWLTSKRYSKIFKDIQSSLIKHSIDYDLLYNTNDIWARDYMPIQRKDNTYIFYKYTPDYLKNQTIYQTNPKEVDIFVQPNDFLFEEIDLIIDGGNIIRANDKIIITDKIFKENSMISKHKIIDTLLNIFEINNVIIIPQQPEDITGHSDGMIRFVDNNTILLNDFSLESKAYNNALTKSIKNHNLEIIRVQYSSDFFKNKDWGAYLNYMQIGNTLLLPIYNIKEDERIYDFFTSIFINHNIETIDSNFIINGGGALNCISWNIKV